MKHIEEFRDETFFIKILVFERFDLFLLSSLALLEENFTKISRTKFESATTYFFVNPSQQLPSTRPASSTDFRNNILQLEVREQYHHNQLESLLDGVEQLFGSTLLTRYK